VVLAHPQSQALQSGNGAGIVAFIFSQDGARSSYYKWSAGPPPPTLLAESSIQRFVNFFTRWMRIVTPEDGGFVEME
jgi:hypothetical protein